jgi:hypothetical protein
MAIYTRIIVAKPPFVFIDQITLLIPMMSLGHSEIMSLAVPT